MFLGNKLYKDIIFLLTKIHKFEKINTGYNFNFMQLPMCHPFGGFLLHHYLSYRGLHPCLGDVDPLGLGEAQFVRKGYNQLLIDFVELTFLNS